MGGGVLVRVGGKHSSDEPRTDWWRFLSDTQAWVEPATLTNLVSLAEAVSAGVGEGTQLTAASLCKGIFLRMESAPSPGLSRSMVRAFVKHIFSGGAFQFPAEIGQIAWYTPFSNKLVKTDLIRAYARGMVRRLGSKFILTVAELPELLKFLFPPEMADAEEALRQALAEGEKLQK